MSEFQDYVNHGWKLCRIQRGQKGPRAKGWNEESNCITRPEIALHLESAGLCHAYSGTAALDIDDMDRAVKFLQEHGINLYALLEAPDAVQILSGRSNRGKLLYALDTPIPSKTFGEGCFELRCGTTTGRTAQDVLPPSKHPGGTTYEWKGNWKELPKIPDALLQIWRNELESTPVDFPKSASGTTSEIRSLLLRKDPDCGYDEWIKIGMALHHETEGAEEGFALWDFWSAKSSKYPGTDSLRSHWVSFGRSANPVTVDSLRKTDIAAADEFDDLTAEPEDWLTGGSNGVQQAEKEKALGFKFLPLGELFLRPKPDWIIPGVLPQAGLGAFWGQPGGGKTFLAVDTALTVALGQLWRGRSVERGEVLYIAAEDDAGVQTRFAAGLAVRGAVDAPVRVLPAAPSLMDPAQAKALMGAITGTGKPSLIFFDTLAAVTPGSDENAAKDMSRLIQYCHQIHKATGALVILIHHEGKSVGKGPRGWSGLHGAFDVEWAVSDEEGRREMRISKMKNAETGKSYAFKLAPVGDSCVVEWI